jgi:hypothetical protein
MTRTTIDSVTVSGQEVPAGTCCVLLGTCLEGLDSGKLIISVLQGIVRITPYGVTS